MSRCIPRKPKRDTSPPPPTKPTKEEPADNTRNKVVESKTYSVDPLLNKDPKTPAQPKQSNQPETEKANSTSESTTQNQLQIEGHTLSPENHVSRSHILYSLTNLNILPRRSSPSISYLNASQRRMRQTDRPIENPTEMEEIQSKITSTEKRIALVPIQLQNRFQALQRRPGRKGGNPSGAKSL